MEERIQGPESEEFRNSRMKEVAKVGDVSICSETGQFEDSFAYSGTSRDCLELLRFLRLLGFPNQC